MIELSIDNNNIQVPEGSTVMEAAEQAGIFIPHFCYHNKLSIAANCRMCLVEVEKSRKPLPACATPATTGMKVYTNSEFAKDAQKGVMEMLLINHPLDCPICDQGGECQLQDLAVGYGGSNSRFDEEKRVVFHKNMGPLISAEEMSRCIHCTRCVRFGEELAGIKELGMPGRGEHAEIMTYLGDAVESELSGNMIDICPVGALTSKPFRYTARTWELDRVKAISPHDCIGTNIIVQAKDEIVRRVVPHENELINECWISDRDRFSYEALNSSDRLLEPMVKDESGNWRVSDWSTAIKKSADIIKDNLQNHGGNGLRALSSAISSTEELALLARLVRELGSDNLDFRPWLADPIFDVGLSGTISLGVDIQDLEQLDGVFAVGCRLRDDSPLLAKRLRVGVNKFGLKFSQLTAFKQDLFFEERQTSILPPSEWPKFLSDLIMHLDPDVKDTDRSSAGYHGEEFSKIIKELRNCVEKKQFLLLLGPAVFFSNNASLLIRQCLKIRDLIGCKIGFLPPGGNFVGAHFAKFFPRDGGLNACKMFSNPSSAFVLMNVDVRSDFLDVRRSEVLKEASGVIALTSFRSAVEEVADVMLPVAAFTETEGSYINIEGRLQHSNQAVTPPGEVRAAWKVLRVLGSVLDLDGFNFDTLEEVKEKLLPEALTEKRLRLDPVKYSNKLHLEHNLKIDGSHSGLETFAYYPIYSSDVVVRRAVSLQKTRQSESPKAYLNSFDLEKFGVVDGDLVEFAFSDSRPSFCCKCVQSESVAKGVIAIAAGNLKFSNVQGLVSDMKLSC